MISLAVEPGACVFMPLLPGSAICCRRFEDLPAKEILQPATDEELAEAAQRGEMEAFEELVARHRHRVYARAFAMLQHHEDALDLAQDAWVKIWQKLDQFQGKSSFLTWMTRIVINLCLDQLRRRQRQQTESLDELKEQSGGSDWQMPAFHANPSEGIEWEELRGRIADALGRLTQEHRTVLVLHEFEELAYKEIARTLGCSIGTVMSRLFYARRNLGALLREEAGPTTGKSIKLQTSNSRETSSIKPPRREMAGEGVRP
jgi:RNA polymerase sigma-70 factor (ECF subfamily)